MRFHVLTLFPEMFESLKTSIIGKAIEKNLIDLQLTNIRDFSKDKHKKVDDTPYGGGAGMVMRADIVYDAYTYAKQCASSSNTKAIYLSPQGKKLNQEKVVELSKKDEIILICGHYEGIDQRAIDIISKSDDFEEISIGDYVLTGGELAAAVMADAIVRIIPGVISDEQSALSDSFQDNLLAAPVYTRPADYKGWKVPDILLSGHEAKIKEWELQQSLERTRKLRPDLLGE